MQRPDEHKRREIIDAATRLFASRPFHEVRLDDVAAAAKVGKGTLYVYFQSKEDLYLSLIREGFAEMVRQAGSSPRPPAASAAGRADEEAWGRLRSIIAALVGFAVRFPDLYRIMRSGVITPEDPGLQRTRAELVGLIEGALRDGVARGVFDDPHPELTVQFILSFVRGALLYPPPDLTPQMLEDHIMRLLRRGIAAEVAA